MENDLISADGHWTLWESDEISTISKISKGVLLGFPSQSSSWASLKFRQRGPKQQSQFQIEQNLCFASKAYKEDQAPQS